MLVGIDISQHQSTTPDLDGLSFIVLRASIGTATDTRYAQHYAAARAAGLVVMAYHYGFAADKAPIAAQAAVFLSAAKDADFLWLDQEDAGFDDAQAQQFIDEVRKVRPCGLYHSASGFGGVKADAKWVADWRLGSVDAGYPRTADGSKEFPGWTLWQWNGAGTDGIDNDYWNPASPIAGLLRQGYVTQGKYDADTESLRLRLAAMQLERDAFRVQVDDLNTDLAEKAAEIAHLTEENLALEADLKEAPGIERERIANEIAGRIKAL